MIQDSDRLTVPIADYDAYIGVLRGMASWWESGPSGRSSGGQWYRRNVRGLYAAFKRPNARLLRQIDRRLEMACL